MSEVDSKKIERIVDANFNRCTEGLRVCEDIVRFVLDDQKVTKDFKNIRHDLTSIIEKNVLRRILKARSVSSDVGQGLSAVEMRRKTLKDVFFANCQRAKESTRVLEEIAKIMHKPAVIKLKKIRYQLYVLEQKVAERL